jgi:hypothetical protein
MVGGIYKAIALEDINGDYNPGAWSQFVQQAVGGLNAQRTAYSTETNRILQSGTFTFTGNITGATSATAAITSVSILASAREPRSPVPE